MWFDHPIISTHLPLPSCLLPCFGITAMLWITQRSGSIERKGCRFDCFKQPGILVSKLWGRSIKHNLHMVEPHDLKDVSLKCQRLGLTPRLPLQWKKNSYLQVKEQQYKQTHLRNTKEFKQGHHTCWNALVISWEVGIMGAYLVTEKEVPTCGLLR